MTNRFVTLIFLFLCACTCPAADGPDLKDAGVTELATALTHTNTLVRETAARLLIERNDPETEQSLRPLVSSLSFRGFDEAKGEALRVLHRLGKLSPGLLAEAIATDGKPALQTNALRLAAAGTTGTATNIPAAERAAIHTAILKQVRNVNSSVRLAALQALASFPVTEETRATLIDLYPGFSTGAVQNAALVIAAQAPAAFIADAAADPDAGALTNLVSRLAASLDAEAAAQLLIMLAAKPGEADPLKRAALESFSGNNWRGREPVWSDDLAAAFKSLFERPSAVAAVALPLAAAWDKSDALKAEAKTLITSLLEKAKDNFRPDQARAQFVTNVLAARRFDTNVLPALTALLSQAGSPRFKRKVVAALAGTAETAADNLLVHSLTNLPIALRHHTLAHLTGRGDGSLAARATAAFAAARRPEEQEKDALLARFTPETDRAGDVKHGEELFTQNCAACHKFNGEGKELGPDLTGFGVRGTKDLLVHILDPDRQVDPAYLAVNIELKDGLSYTGMVVSESKSAIVLRDAAGEREIKTEEIHSRANSRRSLMPEGFETLGAENLRDLSAFMVAAESPFRRIDLGEVFTADGTGGIFGNEDKADETLPFLRFGSVKAGKVPFDIGNPARTTNGNNLIVLRGGTGRSKQFPARIELKDVGLRATKLHFLGGVGAGAWPCCGDQKNEGLPVARVTVHYTGGEQEQFILTNGVAFVDFANADADVNGSKRVPGLLKQGHVRSFSRKLAGSAVIERITLESLDTAIIPVFVAITAELESSKPEAQSTREGAKPKAQAPTRKSNVAKAGVLNLGR